MASSSHFPSADLSGEDAARVLAAVVAIANRHLNLAERRRALVTAVGELVQADCGFWSWGRGWPAATAVAPIAIIDFGFTDKQRSVVIEWGLDERSDWNFRQPIMARMALAGTKRSTDIRRDIISDEQWVTFPPMRQQLILGGWESWLHSVQYSDNDTWSNFFLLRNAGQPEFGHREAALVDLALNHVSWLHSTAEEYLSPEVFADLTPRQRTVMLLLLDGLARKTIARQLDIGEETVGDHIKSIYSHFHVNSAGELAALFLRAR